jgi:hypothetical protein
MTSKKKTEKIFVVVTLYSDGEREYFCDVALLTKDESKAKELTQKLKAHKKIPGYDWLVDYEDANYFPREIITTITKDNR